MSGEKKSVKTNNFFVRMGKGIRRFFKDFKGELKKIVWTSKKEVVKSTGIVLLVVLIVALAVFGMDTALSAIIKLLMGLGKSGAEEAAAALNVFAGLIG